MPDLLSKVAVSILTAGLGFLVALYLRKKKVIAYDVFSIPLVKFKPKKERPLMVSVDKFVLTGKEEHKGIQVPVSNAYGFDIVVVNVGNEEIPNLSIEIRLNESAKIIEYETQPGSETHYNIEIEKDLTSLNVLRFLVPYINRDQRFLIRLISTET